MSRRFCLLLRQTRDLPLFETKKNAFLQTKGNKLTRVDFLGKKILSLSLKLLGSDMLLLPTFLNRLGSTATSCRSPFLHV